MKTEKVYSVNKNNIDNEFTVDLCCDKCGYIDLWENFEVLDNIK